jgi:hypothetical protein
MIATYPQTPHVVVCDLPHGPEMSMRIGCATPRHAQARKPSAVFLRRADGAGWEHVETTSGQAVIGEVVDFADVSKPYQGECTVDSASRLRVRLFAGRLYSTPIVDAVLGASMLMVGSELLAFTKAEQIESSEWMLSGMVRGLRDTSTSCGGHMPSEPVMLMSSASVRIPYDPSQVGQRWAIKAAAAGQSLADVPIVWEGVLSGASGVPMRPAIIDGRPVARSRWVGTCYDDRTELPASEIVERWEWSIAGGRPIVRQIGAMGAGRWTERDAPWVCLLPREPAPLSAPR